jgi:hypothetical protein
VDFLRYNFARYFERRQTSKINRERQRMDFGSHAKVDEDEGSPLRNGANHFGGDFDQQQNGKIESSAEAFRVCHTPFIFPSR